MEFVIMFIAGVVVGSVVATIMVKQKSIGILKICDYDSERGDPYLFLELHSRAIDLHSKKYVTMEVKDISPK